MATLTHAAFRTLVWEYGGCDLYFSEMISAEALLGGSPFEYAYRDARPDPGRLIYQLVGRTGDAIVEAASHLAAEPVHGIDVNMGCSAPKIAKSGAGVTWMSYPREAAHLISRLREVAPGKTVSAKIRLGISEDSAYLARFARELEAAGVSFITLHPRLKKQSYSRPSRWRSVRLLREAVSVPVFGSGDITDFDVLRTRAEETGVEGIMIGRAAAQRPWLFADIRRADRATGTAPLRHAGTEAVGDNTKWIDLRAVAARFHELAESMLPEAFLPTRARRFYAYFLKNLAFGHRLAAQLQHMDGYEDIRAHVFGYFDEHPEYRRLETQEAVYAYS